MSEPRMVSPEEAREFLLSFRQCEAEQAGSDPWTNRINLAYTATVLGEQRILALSEHESNEHGDCRTCRTVSGWHIAYPCPTARALGVVR